MMKSWKFLLVLFISLVIVKSLLASLVLAPSMFSDEYEYAKIAQNFWEQGTFQVHDKPINVPPAYSLAISPAYIFDDMRLTYLAIKIINVLLSSLIIFPAYFLAKELMSKKSAFIATILVGILPAGFSDVAYVMAENLFLVLMLTAAYFLYKMLTSKNRVSQFIVYPLLIGFLAFAIYMTKVLGILLLIAIGTIFAIKALENILTKTKGAKSSFFIAAFSVIVFAVVLKFLPLYQYINYLPLKEQNTPIQILFSALLWVLIYIGYLIIASGILPAIKIFSIKSASPKKRTYLLVLGALAIAGIAVAMKHNINISFFNTTIFSLLSGRPMGRYIDYLLPLIIIGGFATLNIKTNKKAAYILSALAIVSAILLSTFDLIPINNSSLSIFGITKLIIENLSRPAELLSASYFLICITAAAIVIVAISALSRCKKATSIAVVLAILFMLTNTTNYSLAIYNSETFWYNGEQMQLGLWINDNKDLQGKSILIDEKYEGKLLKHDQSALHEAGSATILGFWIRNPLKIGSTQDLKGIDYVVTKEKMDLTLIKQTTNGIYLYQVQNEVSE